MHPLRPQMRPAAGPRGEGGAGRARDAKDLPPPSPGGPAGEAATAVPGECSGPSFPGRSCRRLPEPPRQRASEAAILGGRMLWPFRRPHEAAPPPSAASMKGPCVRLYWMKVAFIANLRERGLCMKVGTTWGHPVHDGGYPCAHPVHAETGQKTSPKPLVRVGETGIELRHRRARRRASRRRLRTAGSWETGRPSGPTRSTAGSVRRDDEPPEGNPGTAAQRETAAATGTTRSSAGAEHDDGPPEGNPGTAAQRETAAATGTTGARQVEEGEAGARGNPGRRSGRPRRRCTGPLPPRQHRARPPGPRRATSDAGAAGDRGDDGTRQEVRCTPTTNVGPSGQPDGGEPGDRLGDGPGGRDGGRRCDRRTGRGDLASARSAGNRRTRRGPTDARQHGRSTSRSGQLGRRPAGRATRGPSISYIEGPRTMFQSAKRSPRNPRATRPRPLRRPSRRPDANLARPA